MREHGSANARFRQRPTDTLQLTADAMLVSGTRSSENSTRPIADTPSASVEETGAAPQEFGFYRVSRRCLRRAADYVQDLALDWIRITALTAPDAVSGVLEARDGYVDSWRTATRTRPSLGGLDWREGALQVSRGITCRSSRRDGLAKHLAASLLHAVCGVVMTIAFDLAESRQDVRRFDLADGQ